MYRKGDNLSKILLFDIETAGVQGLAADRGFVVVFGWKWLGDKKTHSIAITQYPGKDIHDDTQLLKAASKILDEADGMVAHFGEKFDKPYLQARLRRARLPPISDNKLTDTCLLARSKFRISSNRLGNLAAFAGLKQQKQDKRGGWPAWWLGALRGDRKSISLMAKYCEQDVRCLEEVYLWLRPVIPTRYLPVNEAVGEKLWTCPACGGHRMQHRGRFFSEKKVWQRLQCQTCGKWGRSQKAIAGVPNV